MSETAPPLDPRTAVEVEQQAVALLKTYAAPWQEFDPATGAATGLSAALTGVFGRFAELIIQRLNRAPDKNLLAFLDLIGASQQPPQAARVPLTFSLAVGAQQGAVVPAGTQVAAPPGDGRGQPVIFETERELSVTPAQLTRVVSWDGVADRHNDISAAAIAPLDQGAVLFRGDAWQESGNEHMVYFGLDEPFGLETIYNLTLNIQFNDRFLGSGDTHAVIWEAWDGANATPLPEPSSPSAGSSDGILDLTAPGDVTWYRLQPIPLSTVAGVSRRWLRARLDRPLNFGVSPDPARVLPSSLPSYLTITQAGLGGNGPLPPDASFRWLPPSSAAPYSLETPVDTSLDFCPFGDTYTYGAVWYLASRAVFSKAGRRVRLTYVLSSSASGRPWPTASASSGVQLTWEYWTGRAWFPIGTSSNTSQTNAGPCLFSDDSGSFTAGGGTGNISWVFADAPQPALVNGVENYWLRIRVTGGAHGYPDKDEFLRPFTHGVTVSMSSLQLTYTNDNTYAQRSFDAVIRYDGMRYQSVTPSTFQPFTPAEDPGRSLYCGFELPATQAVFPQRGVSLYFDLQAPAYGDIPDQPMPATRPRLAWSYWNGSTWQRLLVRDDTAALTQSGTIEFLPPSDMSACALFDGAARWWLRLSWEAGDYKFLPKLRRLASNTTTGIQAVTVSGEVLGSSSGEAAQRFSARRTPVLMGPVLEVLESELPSTAERAQIAADEGDSAITPVASGGYWVRWHEVGDFYGSGPRDRHYVIEHLGGEVRFGDGVNGLIPPRGAGNLRLASYRTGGGVAGNAAAGTIIQLKTTVPYVASVSNPVVADGGVGAEDLDALRERAPRTIRHNGRAVTIEDYEDLARLATPEVVRARCVPLYDLSTDPDAVTLDPGVVSLIIVPRSDQLKPCPGAELIGRVSDFLGSRTLPVVDLVVIGAEYVSVDVTVEIGLAQIAGAQEIELAVQAALTAFLHPLSGSLTGQGWDFGRRPHRSDLYALLEAVPGVDYVRTLEVAERPDRPGGNLTDRFLVCSGTHRIDLYLGA